MVITEAAQPFEEAGYRRDTIHVAGDGFDDDRRNFAADRCKYLTYPVKIIVGQGAGLSGHGGGNAGRGGHAEGEGAGAGLDQQGVGVAMVAALELDNAVAPGKAPRQADGAHGGLGARVDHAHHVHRRHQLAEQIGHAGLDFRGRTEAESLCRHFPDRTDHVGMCMTGNHRSPRADVIDVALVIDIEQPGPFTAAEEYRVATDPFEGAHRRVDATGNMPAGSLVKIV